MQEEQSDTEKERKASSAEELFRESFKWEIRGTEKVPLLYDQVPCFKPSERDATQTETFRDPPDLLQGFISVSSGALKDLARHLQIFHHGGSQISGQLVSQCSEDIRNRKKSWRLKSFAYFCTWSTVWLQKPASVNLDHTVSGSCYANPNVRTNQSYRVNNFRPASFSECFHLSKAISLHRQVFQTVLHYFKLKLH